MLKRFGSNSSSLGFLDGEGGCFIKITKEKIYTYTKKELSRDWH